LPEIVLLVVIALEEFAVVVAGDYIQGEGHASGAKDTH
jgi:hypothetical protein